jgi:thiosulfate/3-mercaptopyruvate sulfurtransferase
VKFRNISIRNPKTGSIFRALTVLAVSVAASSVVGRAVGGFMAVSPDTQLKDSQSISPDELVKSLSSKQAPLVLQVGFLNLYEASHIPASIFAGPAMEAKGLAKLKKEAQTLAKTRDIVIYCGCCPMKDCPNIKPALSLLDGMGFKRVKVLNLERDFVQDWVNKGLPAEKGGA